MVKEKTYTAIVSDRAKRVLASHFRFLANMSERCRTLSGLHNFPIIKPELFLGEIICDDSFCSGPSE